MDNRNGDRVTFRGSHDEYRLIGYSSETGIVQASRFGKFDDNREIVTTDVSEIAYNYTAAARARAKAEGIDEATADSLATGLDQSAEGDVVDLGDFTHYLEADQVAHEEYFRTLNDSDYIKGV